MATIKSTNIVKLSVSVNYPLGSDTPQHGLGFLVHKRISNNIKGFWKACERICVMQLELSPNKVCSIINVYAPQSNITERHLQVTGTFYQQLKTTINQLKNKSLVYAAGDFNAKVGSKQVGENFIGKYGYGLPRNCNGAFLVELLSVLNLFLANTALNTQLNTDTHGPNKEQQIENKEVQKPD